MQHAETRERKRGKIQVNVIQGVLFLPGSGLAMAMEYMLYENDALELAWLRDTKKQLRAQLLCSNKMRVSRRTGKAIQTSH
jgi:hypothetical protein